MQATVAKRFEEHKLFKLQCEKLALEIKKIKENIIFYAYYYYLVKLKCL